ncbi:hypothetical protein LPJ76_005667 [Coemansia sp. RSA 638]|nr:hypothetical protein LPJ76_005667 [Coemansia sp. RSA 638]
MARTCYYELLGVERSAGDADLKKAYRRLALVWHPDKNHGNVEEATRVFAEIKEAYETLSDPQERTWYDNHREQILRGDDVVTDYGQADMGTNTSFMQTEALMRYFSATSFRGFGDTADGFFAVYRELFARLRDEELQSCAESDDILLNLNFGGTHTHYDEDAAYAQGRTRGAGTGSTLRDFYNFWTTFSTRKSFGWFDRYRLADADNRQVRRLMEKENRRLREKARREFVETVQNLATWVRKRDPRYKSFVAHRQHQQQLREDEQRRRIAEQRAAAAEDASTYICQAWEEVDYTSMLGEHGPSSDEAEAKSPTQSAGDLGQDELICVICDKSFKTAAQKANHEKSKKHLKVVRDARREMLREERQMAKMQQQQGTAEDSDSAAQESDDNAAQDSDDSTAQLTDGAEEDALAQLIQELAMAQSSKKSKRKKRPQPNPESTQEPAVKPITDQKPTPDIPTHRPTKRDMRRERQRKQAQNELACNVCAKEFTSRNHLFNHINDTGHALAKPEKAKSKSNRK